mgnify:CR=1 FL=1
MGRLENWLWLANALGPCASNAARVLAEFSSPEEVLERREEWSQWFSPLQLRTLQRTCPHDFLGRLEECLRLDVQIVTWEDADYPSQLRQIDCPPPVLYYRGDLSAVAAPLVLGMIGTRRPSAYGVEAMQFLGQGLAKAGIVLVSGLADGLDGEAHRACLKEGIPTIACLGFGHTHCYPAQNRMMKGLIEKQGLTVSEYPPGAEPQKQFFLQRNRLIAGLGRGVCVVEARDDSATSNTVRHALDYGRDVFSVPGNIFSPTCEGTNRLLREGAIPVTCAEDILRYYGLEAESRPSEKRTAQELNVSPAAKKIYGLLTSHPQPIAQICDASGLLPRQAMAALTELEIAGACQQLSGRQFILKGL